MSILSMHSPVGDITIFEEAGAIVALDWGWVSTQQTTALLNKTKKQLDDYFDGKLKAFDLPLNPTGTSYEKNIWQALEKIPYGQTVTYGELANKQKSHARAIGGACGKNPIPIIIPCHRVLAKNGGMGGYSGDGGVDTKQQLLALEGALKNIAQ